MVLDRKQSVITSDIINSQMAQTLRERDFRGSRFRCLLATSQSRPEVAQFLNNLTPHGISVTENHAWAPNGFTEPAEAKLAETVDFLNEKDRKVLESWWLAELPANTPNWDLVSKCDHNGTDGLILVEAKAHHDEFNSSDTCGAGPDNLACIKQALKEANDAWNNIASGFSLSVDSKYQLSNRFAFAWKVASLGIPVVLVYLGFLNADDMSDYKMLKSHEDWEECVKSGGQSRVPKSAWNQTFHINNTPLTVSIRSATVKVTAEAHMQVKE